MIWILKKLKKSVKNSSFKIDLSSNKNEAIKSSSRNFDKRECEIQGKSRLIYSLELGKGVLFTPIS